MVVFSARIPRITSYNVCYTKLLRKNKPRFDLLFAILPVKDIKQKAKEKQVSITDYLVAIYLLVVQEIYFDCKNNDLTTPNKIARIQVPVNSYNFV